MERVLSRGPDWSRSTLRQHGQAGPCVRCGRAVLLECLRRMQARGMNRVCVSTGESNTPAIQLYESVGFRRANKYLDYVKGE